MSTTMMPRPLLGSLVKEAMEGTAAKVDIEIEAARQLANVGEDAPEQTKEASADPDFTPSDHIEKVANALDFLSKQAAEGTTSLGPGQGPNETGVLEAKSSEENIDTPGLGSATSKHVPPKAPPTQKGPGSGDPGTAMESNDDMQHPEQPADPMQNEKTSSALLDKNLARLGLKKQAGKLPSALKATKIPKGTDLDQDGKTGEGKGKPSFMKEGSGLLAKNLARLGLTKQAEDAINPAKISGGGTHDAAKPPEGASPSEEGVPSEPSDVNKQKSMVSSNDSAINYKKQQAKADPKSDVNKVLTEPAQTKSTDPVLHKTLDHASSAGVKISSARLTKTAAAQALLAKLAQGVEEEKKKKDEKKNGKKEKESQMGGMSTPAGQSGFSASAMM